MMKTPKETSVLIAFQKPNAIWNIKIEDVPQLWLYKTSKHVRKTHTSTQHTLQQSNTTYCIHVLHTTYYIYHMNGTQVMSAISSHDFTTKPYVKAPRYDKTSRYRNAHMKI